MIASTPCVTDFDGCLSAAHRLADMVCLMYHRGDEKARLTFPTTTWAEIIAEELSIERPRTNTLTDTLK